MPGWHSSEPETSLPMLDILLAYLGGRLVIHHTKQTRHLFCQHRVGERRRLADSRQPASIKWKKGEQRRTRMREAASHFQRWADIYRLFSGADRCTCTAADSPILLGNDRSGLTGASSVACDWASLSCRSASRTFRYGFAAICHCVSLNIASSRP